MKINNNIKKFFLAVLIALSSVLWLNVWHQISYRQGEIVTSPFLHWLSDAAFVFLPVLIATWIGVTLIQWMSGNSEERLSATSQTILVTLFVGALVSAVILMIETQPNIQIGLNKDLSLAISVCSSSHPAGFSIFGFLLKDLPAYKASRVYLYMQDFSNVMLVTMATVIFYMMIVEKLEAAWFSIIKARAIFQNPKFTRAFNIAAIIALVVAGFFQARAMPAGATDETKVPHYFGPYPNWANSPFRVPDVSITISGGGGTGATAAATVDAQTGVITGLSVTNPGSGYTSAPTVSFASATGTGAAATAVVDYSGVVNQVAGVVPGTGYVAPVVDITGGGGSGAAATAYGSIEDVTIVDGGAGYTQPIVMFDLPADPNGIQATGHVPMVVTGDAFDGLDANGTITAVVVDNAGSGYTTAPGITFSNGTLADPQPGVTAFASATTTLSIQNVVLTAFGSGYTSDPSATITDTVGTGAGAGVALHITTSGGAVTSINLDNGGTSYMTPGIKKFTDQLPGLCYPGGALAAAGVPDCPTTGKFIPLAVSEPKIYSGVEADEFVIGLVQYRTSFSSSIPDTLVRGYVQIETAANASISQHVPLFNEFVDGRTPQAVMINGQQAYGVTAPQYLGPTIYATKDRPVRIVFHNLLPTGVDGDLFLPTDASMMGAGMGPMGMAEPVNNNSVTDEVRNPICGETPKPDICFKDNRATLHLHGGASPWISDGTPHQWITPAGETTQWPQGVSVESVPDMNVCQADNDGCMTFYYTNQQSARLMFYHDHAWGITRLNVYAGEAAGYLITDAVEQSLVSRGLIPGLADTLPLIIQDKTFVPGDAQMYGDPANGVYGQDPTWDASRWGGEGSMWFHHVYMPAQNPGDASGMSAYGRWMYGPWFWPPATNTVYGPISNPYFDPNCNLDDPTTWQYQVDPFCEPEQIPGTPNISTGMEQFNDTPLVNGVAYPTTTVEPKTYRLRILNAANDRFFNLQWYVADPTQGNGETEVALKAAELEAAQTDPVVFPTPDMNISKPGPDWVQIGTEGGFLPAPVVIDGQQFTTWITDPTRFDVGNVDKHSLLLGSAERADVIVDFSQFAGKTLILYNDAPAAFPARVPTYDYYTGAPDLSPTGAPTIVPGYGPNTRTVMQIKVAAAAPAPAFNLTALQNAFKHQADGSGVFEAGQPPIIVGQAAYNTAYGTAFAGASNCNVTPTSTVQRCDGLVRVNNTASFGFNTLLNPTVKMTLPLQPKAIHDEMNSTSFDEFGRMQAYLGVEAQPPAPGAQNVTLYPYVNPATEFIDGTNLPKGSDIKITPISSAADGTQIWRITHNGVDTHPLHFHLYDVQLINRVTWDNIIIPPDANELGWKDTVRISPLEDTIVALRPIIPVVPFELPNAVRALNPMMPLGSTKMFNNVDPQGNPTTTIANQMVNFGWEYVYHCHILTHEEMDMMRPQSLVLPPLKPDGLAFSSTGIGVNRRLILSWNDNSITETSFVVQILNGANWTDVGTITSPLDQPNVHETRTFTVPGVFDPTAAYQYRIVARNTVGYGAEFPTMTAQSISATLLVGNLPAAPSNLAATLQAGPQVSLTWTDNANSEDGFIVERSSDGVNFAQITTTNANITSFVDTTALRGNTYTYRVVAFNTVGNSDYSNTAEVIISPAPLAPTNLTAALTGTQVDLTWTDNATSETGFAIERATNGGAFTRIATAPAGLNLGTVNYTDMTAEMGTTYTYRVAAIDAISASAYSNTVDVIVPLLPAAPSNLTGVAQFGPQALLNWTDNATDETGFIIERSDNGGAFTQIATPAANATTYTDTTVVLGNTYTYRVAASNVLGASAFSNTADVATLLPAAPSNLTGVAQFGPQARLTWTDNATNESGFIIERSDNGGTFTQIATPAANATTYTDTTVVLGNTYTYRVAAANVLGASAFSNTADVATLLPAAPSNLTGVAQFGPQARLTWTDNATNETGFIIERSDNGGTFTQIATLAANVTSFVDTTVVLGNTYTYRVAASNVLGASAFSNTADVVIMLPTAPSNLTVVATQTLPQQASLTWRDNATNESGFIVMRSTNNGAYAQIATVPASANSGGQVTYVDTTVIGGNTYVYRVAATNALGDSLPSNTVQVVFLTLPAAPTNLTATLQAGPQISLVMVDNASNESGFIIERSTNGGAFVQIATAPARNQVGNNVRYTDTTVVLGNTYAYRVAATNVVGNSAYSNTAQVVVPAVPAAPSNFTATRGPNNGNTRSIVLNWVDNSNNETGFTIERATNTAFTQGYSRVRVAANTTTYRQTGLGRSVRYYFRIRADNGTIIASGWVNASPFPVTTAP